MTDRAVDGAGLVSDEQSQVPLRAEVQNMLMWLLLGTTPTPSENAYLYVQCCFHLQTPRISSDSVLWCYMQLPPTSAESPLATAASNLGPLTLQLLGYTLPAAHFSRKWIVLQMQSSSVHRSTMLKLLLPLSEEGENLLWPRDTWRKDAAGRCKPQGIQKDRNSQQAHFLRSSSSKSTTRTDSKQASQLLTQVIHSPAQRSHPSTPTSLASRLLCNSDGLYV
jgi:hypothetical protein